MYINNIPIKMKISISIISFCSFFPGSSQPSEISIILIFCHLRLILPIFEFHIKCYNSIALYSFNSTIYSFIYYNTVLCVVSFAQHHVFEMCSCSCSLWFYCQIAFHYVNILQVD